MPERKENMSPAAALDPAASDATNENARNGAKKRRDPNEPAAVVGIGASAGGIAALQQLFGDMKTDTGLAFVVVMHLSPEVEPQHQLGKRITIDLFFRTLAQAYGQRAVCVIMSGTDSDGVIGLKHIRAQGGVTIAQDPNEAEFDSMPAAAIESGMVDWVLS